MATYTHLTRQQRYQISRGLKQGYTQTCIAEILGVHRGTIGREIRRNRSRRGYQPRLAHQQACARRVGKVKPRLLRKDWQLIERLLRQHWSPEQISQWLCVQGHIRVSPEWIYQYVRKDKDYGGDLCRHLRCQKRRRRRYGSSYRQGGIPNRVSIDERPAIVNQRQRQGDWELDTVYGKNNTAVMVTMVERASRYVYADILPNRTAAVVSATLIRVWLPIRTRVLTLTADNGSEFTRHEEVAHALGAAFYFAHPYASWERGTNENMNGLIRQYFPKQCDLSTVTTSQLRRALDELNNRPRKCLDMRTPNEVLFGIKPNVALHG